MTSNKSPLAARLWQYQAERSPLIPLIAMAAVTVGLLARFAEVSLVRYLATTLIVLLYLIQIRTSDEKKDFEHDNRFYPRRPVQRGLVSLTELAWIGRTAIAGQLLLYASFLDWRILGFGLLSQAYGYLCKKEFFVRDWIRSRFFIYTYSHYIQLIFLFGAAVAIIHPANWQQLLAFTMINVIVVELGRKTKPSDQDMGKDTYSAHLGYPGTATALIVALMLNLSYECYLFATLSSAKIWLILPVATAIWVSWKATLYGRQPNKTNQSAMENAVLLNFVADMFSLVIGIR